jgi:hypothetical protein
MPSRKVERGIVLQDNRLLDLRYVGLCHEIEIVGTNMCAIGGFMLLGLVSLVMLMANFHKEETNLPVRRSSTHRLFNTLVVSDDDTGSAIQSIVTPVTEAAMDPLM